MCSYAASICAHGTGSGVARGVGRGVGRGVVERLFAEELQLAPERGRRAQLDVSRADLDIWRQRVGFRIDDDARNRDHPPRQPDDRMDRRAHRISRRRRRAAPPRRWCAVGGRGARAGRLGGGLVVLVAALFAIRIRALLPHRIARRISRIPALGERDVFAHLICRRQRVQTRVIIAVSRREIARPHCAGRPLSRRIRRAREVIVELLLHVLDRAFEPVGVPRALGVGRTHRRFLGVSGHVDVRRTPSLKLRAPRSSTWQLALLEEVRPAVRRGDRVHTHLRGGS